MFLWDVSSYGEGMMLFAAPSVVIQRQLSWQWSAASSGLGPPSYRRPMASCKEIPPLHGKPVRIHVRFVQAGAEVGKYLLVDLYKTRENPIVGK